MSIQCFEGTGDIVAPAEVQTLAKTVGHELTMLVAALHQASQLGHDVTTDQNREAFAMACFRIGAAFSDLNQDTLGAIMRGHTLAVDGLNRVSQVTASPMAKLCVQHIAEELKRLRDVLP